MNHPENVCLDGVEIVPRDHFDAWFFLRESLLDRTLPARPMWRP